MKKYTIVLLVISALFVISCSDYVDIEDQTGTRTLKYTSDYQYLLNNTSTFEFSYGYPLLTSDDAGIEDPTYQESVVAQWGLAYTWSETFVLDEQEDSDWNRFYKQINVCNQITDGVSDSEKGTVEEKKSILAQAKVHRAYAYLKLVNLYAPPYNEATASNDLGLPLLTTAYLFSSLKRVSVETIYQQIIADLTSALPNLPDLPDYNSDPSKVAVYALLSETNLEMRNFTKASLYADSTLSLQNTIIDLNDYASSPQSLPKKLQDPETIFSKLVGGNFYSVILSSDLIDFLGTKDLRYQLFTEENYNGYGRSYSRQNYTYEGVYIGPNVPEIMLIKAECLARGGDYTASVDLLNNLRTKRFRSEDYEDLTVSSAEEALALVINERRRELFGRGFRWFDMRRLNQDSAFAKEYTRTFKGTKYTLPVNSNRYTYAIGGKYISLNPEIEQNPR